MSWRSGGWGSVLGLLVLAASAEGQSPHEVEILSPEEEMRLALSAAPDHLRDGAGYWALGEAGYEEVKATTNGFTCIINRDHALNLKPTCYDEEGTRTILPKVVFFGNELLKGRTVAEIQIDVQAGFESGRFVPPQRSGIAYMLTNEIRTYNPGTGQFGTFPPHLMFYGPNLTNADVGAPRQRKPDERWMPFVAYQGPHGFIIVVVS